jgi:hypothetical protein
MLNEEMKGIMTKDDMVDNVNVIVHIFEDMVDMQDIVIKV